MTLEQVMKYPTIWEAMKDIASDCCIGVNEMNTVIPERWEEELPGIEKVLAEMKNGLTKGLLEPCYENDFEVFTSGEATDQERVAKAHGEEGSKAHRFLNDFFNSWELD